MRLNISPISPFSRSRAASAYRLYIVRILAFFWMTVWLALLPAQAEVDLEINTMLMHWTFKIEGPSSQPGRTSIGTVFVIGDVLTNQPTMARLILVTAAHVLNGIAGEQATLVFRRRNNDGNFQRLPCAVRIRENAKDVWVEHPNADVAAMYVSLPTDHGLGLLIPMSLLVNDKALREFEIHPGDQLFCLGFPNGTESNQMGFPILRSGEIASYPLTPAKQVGSFFYDCDIYSGNSGGPVYFSQPIRRYGGETKTGRLHFIAGLVSKRVASTVKTVTPLEINRNQRRYEVREEDEQLGIGVVIPAEFIRETIEMLRNKAN